MALPAAFSLLRLWVESGGQMQTTLLLVANVNAVNLFAAMFITGTRLVTMGLVAVFAIGGILGLSADAAEAAGEPLRRRPLFARWVEAAPLWLLTTTFVLAAATWKIFYLPLLVPAFVATFQATPAYRAQPAAQRLLAATVALPAYAWMVWPTLGDAWRQQEYFALLMFVLPPLLALMISDPVPTLLARLVATTAQPAVLLLLVWAALPVLTTPVLPLTVTTATSADGPAEFIRGHVLGSDDTMTAILQERGGVRYLPNATITARVLCPLPEELPVYQLRVRDFHIEDSLLEAVGRRVRPVTVTDAACRSATAPAR
ncbi:MAG TPA: hypothetical protein VFM55_02500 [Micromonosporaceae bacterium]|nr:hypothetical protein [Micromonosporaceae bacterium]